MRPREQQLPGGAVDGTISLKPDRGRSSSISIGHDMPTEHQLARHPDHVQAIGMIAIETVALEVQLASLLSRILTLIRRLARSL
jgi:hypothetical protein